MTELDRLARRVRWLELNRKAIRIAVASVFGGLGIILLPGMLGGDWPRFHARLTAIALALAVAFVVDIGVAATIAMWELRLARLGRDRGLPRAVLRKQKTPAEAGAVSIDRTT